MKKASSTRQFDNFLKNEFGTLRLASEFQPLTLKSKKMRIRPIVLCLLENRDRILMQEFREEFENYDFFRLPGGGIELGEPATEAVRREIREELQSEILDVEFIEVFENIYKYGGEQKHEIAFLFRAKLTDNQLTEQDVFEFFDNGLAFRAVWVSRQEIADGSRVVFPLHFREMILEGKI